MQEPTRFNQSKPSYTPVSVGGDPVRVPGGPRQEFNTDNIRKFINDRGIKVQWEKSYICPCKNKRTRVADMACPVCHGTGIGYLPPREEIVAIQSQEKGANNVDLGLYDSGTAIGTTFTESNMSFRDRIEVPEVTISQSLLFDVTVDRIENGMFLSYKAESIELAMGETQGALSEGVDYLFDKSQNRFYPKSHLLGTNVSLNIRTVLRYLIIDLLKESRYQYTEKNNQKAKFENLPRKLLLKREDIFVNPEPFSLESDREENIAKPGGIMADPLSGRRPSYFPEGIDD